MTSTNSPVTSQYQQPMHSSPSTTSSSTTLVTFTAPRRTNTASSTSTAHSTLSEASTLSQSTNPHSQYYSSSHSHSNIHPTARSRGRSQTHPVHGSHGVPSRNRNSDVTMTPQQAELLRYKGTYTDSGRHSDDWLFGGWSFVGTVKGAWRKVAPGTNGRLGEESEGEKR